MVMGGVVGSVKQFRLTGCAAESGGDSGIGKNEVIGQFLK